MFVASFYCIQPRAQVLAGAFVNLRCAVDGKEVSFFPVNSVSEWMPPTKRIADFDRKSVEFEVRELEKEPMSWSARRNIHPGNLIDGYNRKGVNVGYFNDFADLCFVFSFCFVSLR